MKIVIVVLSEIRWQALRSAGDFEQCLAPHRWRAFISSVEFAQFRINRRQFVGRQSWQFCKNFTNTHGKSLYHKSPRGKSNFREAMEMYRQQHMRRHTSLRNRHPASVGGPIRPITSADDLLGGMLDDARD